MKSKQQEVTHGFKSNMKFMLQKQWQFEKKAFFSSVLYVIFEVMVSVITILVPKIILDMIHNEESETHFVLSVIAITLGWMMFKFINYFIRTNGKAAGIFWLHEEERGLLLVPKVL